MGVLMCIHPSFPFLPTMNTNLNKTLLAFLLSIKDLDSPLSPTETARLSDIAEQLSVNPSFETWQRLTEPSLIAMVQENTSLNQRFQTVKSQLDTLDISISLDLIRSLESELDRVTPHKTKPIIRGIPDDSDERKNNEINNMVMSFSSRALKNPQAVKNLSGLNKISASLDRAT